MGSVFFGPGGEGFVVDVGVGAVVEGRGGVILDGVVGVKAAGDEGGVGGDFLAN